MIEIDKGQHMARVSIAQFGSTVTMNLDLNNLKHDPALRGSGLEKLSASQLAGLLRYTDNRFRLDVKSALPWKEQFMRALRKDCEDFLSAEKTLTPEQVAEFRHLVRQTNLDMAAAAKVSKEYLKPVLSVEYSGFNHLSMDDDFICVKAGGRVVSIIGLPGNDYNRIKNFLREAGDKCLSATNVEDFRLCVKRYRQDKALKLCESKGVSKSFAHSLMKNN